ncbi:MAG: VOC family protein [Proteobacteria bacterium]|nr:MAG: VOC family protein [Pseudomonadota bacterium]
MKINPYLEFNGHCEAAFRFYEKCLGGKIEMMMKFSETPAEAPVPDDWKDKIMHAALCLGTGDLLMGSDSPPEYQQQPQGFSVSIAIDEPDEAERVFAALAENATIKMPMQETFWAIRFGMLVDQFGIPWMVNCGRPD